MATKTSNSLTLLELAKRIAPNGDLMTIAEVLNEDNEILDDAAWVEANDTFSHKITRRLALPTGSFRSVNQGVAIESSLTVQVTEVIGILETFSQVDEVLVKNAPDPAGFRMSEARPFIEGMSQTFAQTLIYGDAQTEPEKFTGLAPRLDSLSQENVYNAGGSGSDVTSLYIVQWGTDRVHLIYPKGAQELGIAHNDLGIETVNTATTAGDMQLMRAYRDQFVLNVGLCVRDERSIARIANIETSGTTNIFDEDLLIKALNKMPSRGRGAVIYANDTLYSQMDINAKDKANVLYGIENIWGVPTVTFRGFPVRKVDQILDTETAIS